MWHHRLVSQADADNVRMLQLASLPVFSKLTACCSAFDLWHRYQLARAHSLPACLSLVLPISALVGVPVQSVETSCRAMNSLASTESGACWLHVPSERPSPCRPFIESNNKGPHFWDEQHPWTWYTDIYSPVAQAVDASAANKSGPLAVDASSNTFTISGVNVRNTPNDQVLLRACCVCTHTCTMR